MHFDPGTLLSRAILEETTSCILTVSLFSWSLQQNLTAIVHTSYYYDLSLHTKYGIKVVKWYVITSYLAASWAVTTIVWLMTVTGITDLGTTSSNGFCFPELSEDSILLQLYSVVYGIGIVVCLGVTTTFGILTTLCYVKKNTIEESTAVAKKAVAKALLYHSIKVFFLVGIYVTGFVFTTVQSYFESGAGAIFLVTAN